MRNEVAHLGTVLGQISADKASLEEGNRALHNEKLELMDQLARVDGTAGADVARLTQEKAELEGKLERERKKFKAALAEAEAYFGKVREHMLRTGASGR